VNTLFFGLKACLTERSGWEIHVQRDFFSTIWDIAVLELNR